MTKVVKSRANKAATKKAVKPTEVKQEAKKTMTWAEKVKELQIRQDYETRGLAILKEMENEKKRRPGVIQTILDVIKVSDKPLTQTMILAKLMEQFPDRKESSMTNTIKAQIGGKKRPLRMEVEKQVIFEIVENAAGVKSYSMFELAKEVE